MPRSRDIPRQQIGEPTFERSTQIETMEWSENITISTTVRTGRLRSRYQNFTARRKSGCSSNLADLHRTISVPLPLFYDFF